MGDEKSKCSSCGIEGKGFSMCDACLGMYCEKHEKKNLTQCANCDVCLCKKEGCLFKCSKCKARFCEFCSDELFKKNEDGSIEEECEKCVIFPRKTSKNNIV